VRAIVLAPRALHPEVGGALPTSNHRAVVTLRSPRDGVLARRVLLLYILLWLLEGALRKWAFPSLQQPLYFIRVPVILYAAQFTIRRLNRPAPLGAQIALGYVAFVTIFSCIHVLQRDQTVVQAVLGTRLWLELVLMPLVMLPWLHSDDARIACRLLSWSTIPIAALSLIQVLSPPWSLVNRLLASDGSDNFVNPGGAVRATGTFTSSYGHALYVTLAFSAVAALAIGNSPHRGDRNLARSCFPFVILLAATSGSRSVFFGCLVSSLLMLLLFGWRRPVHALKALVVFALLGGLLWLATKQVAPAAIEGISQRFSDGGAVQEPSGRALDIVLNWRTFYPSARPFGLGLGSTAQGIGERSLVASETEWEWSQWIVQLGPPLFLIAIAIRLLFCGWLIRIAWSAPSGPSLAVGLMACLGLPIILTATTTSQGSVNGVSVCFIMLIFAYRQSSPGSLKSELCLTALNK
jgi:hypothetical protein